MSKSESPKRWSAKRKQEVVLRLLRGESLDALSRETGQAAATLSQWRDEFLEAGLAGLKRRTDDPKVAALEQELKRAKRLVGDLMMDKELLEMRIARFEGEAPFPKRRSNL
jgi:transposase-like protein